MEGEMVIQLGELVFKTQMTYKLKTACKAPFPHSHRSYKACFHLSWSLFFTWDAEIFSPNRKGEPCCLLLPAPALVQQPAFVPSARPGHDLVPAGTKPQFTGRNQERQRVTHAASTSPGQASSCTGRVLILLMKTAARPAQAFAQMPWIVKGTSFPHLSSR